VLYAHEVILNELGQGLRPTAEGVEWFEGLSEDDRRKVLHTWCCSADKPALARTTCRRASHVPAFAPPIRRP
jgi:hypothetical protein